MCILHANIHDPKKEFFIQFDESGKLSDYESHVGLVHSLVPDTLISLELAETIHFVTQTSRILRQAPKHLEWLSPTLLESHCSMILKLLDPIEDFRPLQLSIAIDKFRTFYGQGLWKLIVAESKLFEYVSMIRLFFLGGRGDFLHRFLDLYEESHRIATVHDLNRILRSCQYLLPTLETLHPFIFEPLPADHLDSFPFQPFSSQVTVTWSLPWPLSHIITSDHLHRYSQILMLLLHLKQVQMKLLLLPSCVALVTLRARQQMIRCLYAFETYFQTEMEILYQDFLKTWSQQEDVRAWAQRHTQFVVNASRLLFLENLALRDAFANLLKCIHQFCIAVTKHYDLSLFKSNKKRTPPMKEHNLEVLRLNEVFVKEFKFLFLTLQGLRTTASLLPIQHLLLQLDFNWYWSLGPSGVAYYEERNLL
ncbi:Gamma-tubulin complex component 4 [Coelomomyces lativittatus]|nr:Gamma-tubulin complex component 4 [Coelomomyces lativittatus]